MKNVALFALIGATLIGSLIAPIVGCNRTETVPSAQQPVNTPTAVPPESLASDPAKITSMLPVTAVKLKNGKITSLDLRSLSGNELTQAIALATKIDSLEEVSLSGEAVTDSVVEPILQVTSIVRLRLPQTQITDGTLAKLAEGGRLKLLDLTDVTTISDQGFLSIGKMPNLVELNLMNTPVTDESISLLSDLKALRKLRLRGTQISGENVTAFASMPIVDLELSETNFGNAGMAAIAKMPKLEKLNLWLTKIDDKGLAELQGKTSLTLLNLDNVAGVTDQSIPLIVGLQNLELLHLGGTGVTESAVPQLKTLSKLKTLFITRLGISDSTAEELRKEMPSLERFEYRDATVLP